MSWLVPSPSVWVQKIMLPFEIPGQLVVLNVVLAEAVVNVSAVW